MEKPVAFGSLRSFSSRKNENYCSFLAYAGRQTRGAKREAPVACRALPVHSPDRGSFLISDRLASIRLGTIVRNVIGLLRLLGIVTASIWLGSSVFFTVAVGPAIFSPEMQQLFGGVENTFKFYAGGVAIIIFKRFFLLQQICAALALAILLAEGFYLGRRPAKWATIMVVLILGFELVGGLVMQPKMEGLRKVMYSAAPAEQKDQAKRTFGMLHGVSQGANLLVIVGVFCFLLKVSRPPEAGRFSGITKFRT